MNLIHLLDKYHVPYMKGGDHHHVRHGWVGVDCSDCDGIGANQWHLGLSLNGRSATCWRCGRQRFGDVLTKLLGISLREAITLAKTLDLSEDTSDFVSPIHSLDLPKQLGELCPCHLKYLKSRGFNVNELIRLWGIKGIGLAVDFPWRIWIPIYRDGILVSWSTRAIATQKRKYLHAGTRGSIPTSDLLYGWDYVRHSVLICEGIADVWRLGPGSVGTFGIHLSNRQMNLLERIPRRFICLDNDATGRRAARQYYIQLRECHGTTEIVETNAIDPGEADHNEVARLRLHCLS